MLNIEQVETFKRDGVSVSSRIMKLVKYLRILHLRILYLLMLVPHYSNVCLFIGSAKVSCFLGGGGVVYKKWRDYEMLTLFRGCVLLTFQPLTGHCNLKQI